MANIFKGKNILVTGGTGSIGSEIVRKVLQYEPEAVRALSNDENGLFTLQQELEQAYPNLRLLAGDVRDKERLKMAVEGIDFIFHAAALKHVPLCEYNPFEAVKTNVLGTQNLIEAAMNNEVQKLLTISTDKAVNPVNVMGATKLLVERLTISANYYKGKRTTAFSCVRFGNVLASSGSAVPLFREQIKKGGPITITDPDMTRFVMSMSEAVNLLLKAAEMAQGGEVFIFKMSALRIMDLAEVMIEELASHYGYNPTDIRIEIVGRRAGEKLSEELINEEEAANAYETEDMFIISSQAPNLGTQVKGIAGKRYTSRDEPLLSKEAIRGLLSSLREDFT